ncbi:hypothetical protein HAHE_06850 [Haloferula helveola]|uniref:Uncharacterized protein n=1 Tax=Haloferula helveola TaxID=490095 RepID=A0ABM7RIE2_9BACT|nr:hypothetical protein HAHE_06850 [Haloferula helveola]
MVRNGFATLALAFGAQQVAWTLLDYEGLQNSDYPRDAWPYEVNPLFGGVIALIAIVVALAFYEKRWSISRAVGSILAVAAGIHFWVLRHPAEPYKDYGEDNVVRMIVNEFWVGVIMLVVCGIDYVVRSGQRQPTMTEQVGGGSTPISGRVGSDSSDAGGRD